MTDNAHLDPLELDALRAGEPATGAQRAHLAWCEPCRAGLTELHALAAVLRDATEPISVPADRDRAILALAERAARASRRPAPGRVATASRWAAAAMLVVAVGAVILMQRQRADHELAAAPAQRTALTAAQADLDGDGRVTVLDAYALARAVTRGTPQVGDADRHDVDLILAMAVSIDAGALEDE